MISRLACSLAGQTETIRIAPGSVAYQAYGKQETIEDYRCNFGLNPPYRNQISKGPLVVTGVGTNDAVRIVELSGHPFFVATLFLPQLSSKPDAPHPLLVTFLKAVMEFHGRKATK